NRYRRPEDRRSGVSGAEQPGGPLSRERASRWPAGKLRTPDSTPDSKGGGMAGERRVTITVNGEARSGEVEPRTLLVYFLRDHLGLTGTHVGCDTSNCGACTVHLDGVAVKSCTVLAVQADAHEVLTIEGLMQDGKYHPVQAGFWAEHGLQCGYCTPGMIMAAVSLLKDNPDPSEA